MDVLVLSLNCAILPFRARLALFGERIIKNNKIKFDKANKAKPINFDVVNPSANNHLNT